MGCVWRGMLARELVFEAGEEGGRGIEGSVYSRNLSLHGGEIVILGV